MTKEVEVEDEVEKFAEEKGEVRRLAPNTMRNGVDGGVDGLGKRGKELDSRDINMPEARTDQQLK